MSELVEELRAGGRHDSFGAFSLDRKKAQEKMREFQLVDPHEYVLMLIAAAVAGGATRIDLDFHGQCVVWTAHGWELEQAFLEQPLAGLLAGKDRPEVDAFRLFSIGLNAVFALRPKRVELASGSLHVNLKEDGGTELLTQSAPPLHATRVTVHERWTWRSMLGFDALGLAAPEASLAEARAAWCPIPVFVDGRQISQNDWRKSAAAQAARRGPVICSAAVDLGYARTYLWLDPTPVTQGNVVYVRHGVAVCERRGNLPPLQPNVAIYCDTLTTNVSESGIVGDDTLRAIQSQLPKAVEELVVAECARFAEDPKIRPSLRPELLDAAATLLRFEPEKTWNTPAQSALARLPLFTAIIGEDVKWSELAARAGFPCALMLKELTLTLDEMRATATKGPLLYLRTRFSPPPPKGIIVVWIDNSHEMAVLETIFRGRTKPYATATALKIRRHNIQRWQNEIYYERWQNGIYERYQGERWTALRTHIESECRLVVPVDKGGFEGQLGLPQDVSRDKGMVDLTILVGGRTLCRRSVNLKSYRFRAVIEHPDLSVNLTWDDVEHDETWQRAGEWLAYTYEKACGDLVARVEHADPALDWRPGSSTDRAAAREHVLRLLKGCKMIPKFARDFPVFPTLAGGFVSLTHLEREVEQGNRLRYVLDSPTVEKRRGRRAIFWDSRSPEGSRTYDRVVIMLSTADPLLTLDLLKSLIPDVRWVDDSRRLHNQRIATLLASRPRESPQVPSEALFSTPFKRKGVVGVVAIGRGPSRVRLLRQGRTIETREIALGCRPLEAAVDVPNLPVDDKATTALPGAALDRALDALREACGDLARRAAREYPVMKVQAERDRVERFLHVYMRLHADQLDPELEACPLFLTVEGQSVCLSDIRSSIARCKGFRYVVPKVMPQRVDGHIAEKFTLALDTRGVTTLRTVLGGASLVDYTEGLRGERFHEEFLKQPKVPRALAEGEYLLRMPVNEAGMEGELGLLAELASAEPVWQAPTDVTVLLEDRVLGTLSTYTPVPCRVMLWSDAIRPNGSFSGPSEETVAMINDVIAKALEKAVATLVDGGVEVGSAGAHAVLGYVLMSLASQPLAPANPSPRPDAPLEALFNHVVGNPLLERCSRLSLFLRSDGVPMNLLEISQAYDRYGTVRWVEPENEGTPLDGIPAVRLDAVERLLLAKQLVSTNSLPLIGGLVKVERDYSHMEAYGAQLKQDGAIRLVRTARDAVREIAIPPDIVCIERWRGQVDGIEGEVGIAPSRRGGITLVYEGVAMDTLRRASSDALAHLLTDPSIFENLPVVGMLGSAGFRPKARWEGIALLSEQHETILGIVDQLYAQLGLRLEREPQLRSLFFAYCLARRADWLGRAHLASRSLTVPIFRACGGPPQTLGSLLSCFFKARTVYVSPVAVPTLHDETVVVANGGDEVHEFLLRFFGVSAIVTFEPVAAASREPTPSAVSPVPVREAPTPTVDQTTHGSKPAPVLAASNPVPTAEHKPAPTAEITRKARGTAPPASPRDPAISHSVKSDDPPATSPSLPPVSHVEPSPASRLQRGVATCFRAMALRQQYAWNTDALQRVRVVEDGRKGPIFYDGVLNFNTAHPLAQRFLESVTSPTTIAFYASALFTAYNQALEAVTDIDEMRFMEALLIWHEHAAGERIQKAECC